MRRLQLAARGGLAKKVRKYGYCYLLLLPAVLFFLAFHYAPMYGVTLAFKDFAIRRGIMGSPWVGLKHFERLFGSVVFYEVFFNTVVISCMRLLFGFPAPILFALMLNEVTHNRFKKLTQTISYLPHFISWVVMAGIITEMLSPTRGAVNYLITLFGGKPVHFLADPAWFRPILILTGIWKDVGYGSIIYLAAIAGISVEQYESATIDGASRLRIIRHIILPSILPTVSTMFILQLGGILNAGFDQVFNLYNPLVYSTGDIIDTYVYRVGLSGDMQYSYSTAVGLFKNVVGFVMVVLANVFAGRVGEGENKIW